MVMFVPAEEDEGTVRARALNDNLMGAINSGVQVYSAYEDQKKTKRQAALDLMNTTAKLRESGYDITPAQVEQYVSQQGEQNTFKSKINNLFGSNKEPQSAPVEDIFSKRTAAYTQKKESENRKNKIEQAQYDDLYDQSGARRPFTQTSKGQEFIAKEEYEQRQKKIGAKIPGFELSDPNYIPQQTDMTKLKAAEVSARDMADTSSQLAADVAKYGISSGTGTTEGDRAVERGINKMILSIKNAEGLGQLSSSDLGLAESAIGRLRGPIDKLNPFNSREGAVKDLETVVQNANKKTENMAAVSGYRRTGQAPTFKDPYKQPMPTGSPMPMTQKPAEKMTDAELNAALGIK